MRILHVISDSDRRGAQVFAVDLSRALSQLGHDSDVVALEPGSHGRQLEVPLLGARGRSPLTLFRLHRLAREYDVTIAHGSSTALACALVVRRFVYRQISDTQFWASTMVRRLRVASYLRRASMVVTLSEPTSLVLRSHLFVSPDRLRTVPNGVPRGSFRPASVVERAASRKELSLEDDTFVVLFVGALVPEKGAAVAIDAVKRIDGSAILVVGDGPLRSELEHENESTSLTVRFLGSLEDVVPAYAAADVVVLPSLGGDSMPATLIEAGMCGLPQVSTPIGAIPEVVLDGSTGFIVPPGDAGLLAEVLQRLHADRDLSRRLGQQAERHCVEHFEIGAVARGWQSVLSEVVGRPA